MNEAGTSGYETAPYALMPLQNDMQIQNEQHMLLAAAHRDHAKSLYVHAYHKLHDRTLGQDLVQDTFAKTWRYLARGGKIDVMRAFLYHILNGLIIDEYRKKKTLSLDLLIEKGFEPSVDNTEKLLDEIDGRSAMRLISDLPTKYQQIMSLRYARELSHTEIARITGQSNSTVAVQAHRGLAKLKELYRMKSEEHRLHEVQQAAHDQPIDTSPFDGGRPPT